MAIHVSRDIWCDGCHECAGFASAFSKMSVRELRRKAKEAGWVYIWKYPRMRDYCEACRPGGAEPAKADPKTNTLVWVPPGPDFIDPMMSAKARRASIEARRRR